MAKVSPKVKDSKSTKQKKRSRKSCRKYLKPGALSQLRYSKASATKACTDLGKKRVAVLDTVRAEKDLVLEDDSMDKSPLLLSPVNLAKQNIVGTPKTPCDKHVCSDSRLEALPLDLLVKILCHLHHDQLRAVFHVSQRVRTAVLLARQFHFNYTTPDRSRQEMLNTMTPRPSEHWPFISKGDGTGVFMATPNTPKAPRHGPRPPSRLKTNDMRQISAVLFQETFPPRCMVPSVLSKPKPLFKSLASNRVLFYEDELCQAVAQNKLR